MIFPRPFGGRLAMCCVAVLTLSGSAKNLGSTEPLHPQQYAVWAEFAGDSFNDPVTATPWTLGHLQSGCNLVDDARGVETVVRSLSTSGVVENDNRYLVIDVQPVLPGEVGCPSITREPLIPERS